MKLSIITILSTVAAASAFAPAPSSPRTHLALNVESSRKDFLSAAGVAVAGALFAPSIAGAMDQININDPTEKWETGSPTAKAEAARMERFKDARTQMTSNFAPIKRLTLERKSPVERLDINAPSFSAYKKSYPGLFK